ncbi:MAG TPA: hypothetical protein VGI39_09815, partial [Polyangiaceae bacterium]
FFGNLENVISVRDQFRQAGFDTTQLIRILRNNPDLSPLATNGVTPKVDASRIGYFGVSLGAMEGTIAAAMEPNVKAWFLDVNAGSLFDELIAHSPAIGSVVSAGAAFSFGIVGDVFTWSHPFLQVLENIAEAGDPISYAPYLTLHPQPLAGVATSPRNALQTEVIWDDVVSDEANEAIARAAGWGMATPNVGSNADLAGATVADATNNPRATPFVQISPDANGVIQDTPVKGATAVLVQVGPAEHGIDVVAGTGQHYFQVPYAPPFVRLDTPVPFKQQYQTEEQMGLTFFSDAFSGVVPRVMHLPTVVRDETN